MLVILSILALTALDIVIVKIILLTILGIIFIPLLVLAIYFIINGIKSQNKEKRIISDCQFAYGNVIIPTEIYSKDKKQYISFHFIDYKGNKRSENIKNATAKKIINKNMRGIVAYTETEAILLIEYSSKIKE